MTVPYRPMIHEITDPPTGTGRTPQIHHIVAGMHVGRMSASVPQQIGSVLTVAAVPGIVPEQVKHKHIPLSYQVMDEVHLEQAARWTIDQFNSDRPILIRSEKGLQRPPLVAAMTIVLLGGSYMDAMYCLHRASPLLLTDFRYLALLKAFETKHGPKR